MTLAIDPHHSVWMAGDRSPRSAMAAPKPLKLKVLEGSAENRPGVKDPNFGKGKPGELPSAPETLGAHGERLWHEVGGRLWDLEILHSADLEALYRYCASVDEYRIADETLAFQKEKVGVEHAQIMVTAGGLYIPNPLLKIKREWYALADKLGNRLGLNPVSRARLGVMHAAAGETQDSASKFFERNKDGYSRLRYSRRPKITSKKL